MGMPGPHAVAVRSADASARRRERLDDMTQQDIEHLLTMPAPLLPDVRRCCRHNHRVEVGHDEDVLSAVAPREAGVVTPELMDPPRVAVLPVAHRIDELVAAGETAGALTGAEFARAPFTRLRDPPPRPAR